MNEKEIIKAKEYLVVILSKLFESVGKKYTPTKVTAPNWFLKNTWTTKQESDFKQWFVKYLLENKEAQVLLYGQTASKSKKKQEDRARWFVFNYGWTLKNG